MKDLTDILRAKTEMCSESKVKNFHKNFIYY